MISTQNTYRVDDLIHLPQVHAVHLPVEFVEVLFDSTIVHPVGFSVGFVEQCQHRIAVPDREGIGRTDLHIATD